MAFEPSFPLLLALVWPVAVKQPITQSDYTPTIFLIT
jgi:hypothetical protein